MSVLKLKNPRHEQFAQRVAEGQSHRAAAEACGYSRKSAASIGAQLARLPDVSARILVLRTMTTSAPAIALRGISGPERGIELLRSLKDQAGSRRFETVLVLDEEGKALGLYVPLAQA
jgi:hypothetical protein